MKVGLVGLGKMGKAIACRIIKAGHKVIGFDPNINAQKEAKKIGVSVTQDLKKIADQDIIWLMIPAGDLIDYTIRDLKLKKGKILIDGGNSSFHDSIRRFFELEKVGVEFLDCGTSGGLAGEKKGFSLMIGGNKNAYLKAKPIFKAVACTSGYAYLGPAGAGHYIKMVHNGIEYALLESYAEGFNLLKNGRYKNLDLEKISKVWSKGSIIRSYILELTSQVFEVDQDFKDISGYIGSGQTGSWTFNEAKLQKISVPLIEKSLEIRKLSQETGGDYSTKLVALLRNKFGGHPVKKLK